MTLADIPAVFDSSIDRFLEWLQDNAGFFFDPLRAFLNGVFWIFEAPLQALPFYVVAVAVGLAGWRLLGRGFGLLSTAGLVFCAVLGMWIETVQTLALVLASTVLSVGVGMPIGIAVGYSPSADRFVEPIFDFVQTLPRYIYLLPAIALIGYGPATALLATFTVAMPPVLRLTALGIRHTPIEFLELGESSGVTRLQMLAKIRLPFALASILAGVNQSLMMSFGMAVIAGIVGSGGLGQLIYEAIRTLNIAASVDAAIAIVIVTIIVDRLMHGAALMTYGGQR